VARGDQAAAFAAIEERIRANTEAVLEAVQSRGVRPREAAVALASERVRRAMQTRRFDIF
jgi:glutamate dehydrogenase (NAD(P)+)